MGYKSWLSFLLLVSLTAQAERIKDLAGLVGVRDNQLIGYGLVVGLNGTGDNPTSARFTGQSLRNFLANIGIPLPPGVNLRTKNVAAVAVHATLPPFAKPGQTIDVTVSSLGDAKSLRGGTLLMTPLKGADGQVYAIAQGDLLVGGLSAEGRDGSRITVNVPSVGRIPGGATVEREVPTPFGDARYLTLTLHRPDFTTAQRIAEAINQALGHGTAKPLDSASVQIQAPQDPGQKVSFVSVIENLTLEPGQAPAKVIVNSRTGTVVVNRTVRVLPVAVSHGNLVVTIREQPEVSQPPPFSAGTTQVVPRSEVKIEEEGRRMFVFDPGVTLEELVRAVNQVGAAPSDLVAILEALKSAGALQAELIVI